MTIITSAVDRRAGTETRFRGLDLRVGESTGLLPALPLWIRRHDRAWEHVGHALDRPAQIGGLGDAPWSRLSALGLHDDGDLLRLTGVAQPGDRPFVLTTADPLGRWSTVRWGEPGRRTPPRRSRATLRPHPVEAEAPGLVAWHDFGAGALGDGWIGSEWPGSAWRQDLADGLLRPSGRGEHDRPRFIGVEVRHHELAIATRLRLPAAGAAGGGLELHVDGEPRRVGVERAVDGSVRIVGSAGTIGMLPDGTADVDLSLICGRSTFALEIAPAGGPTHRRTVHRSAGPITAAGMYADGLGAPVGFAWFEYRGGRTAVANRSGGAG